MNRPTRDQTNMRIAEIISERATCGRAKVGCVIVLNHRIISTGYNGPVMGGKHCELLNCDLKLPCQFSVHAEANAIAAAAKAGISLDGSTLYCTHEPCKDCAKIIVQSGIIEVKWKNPYTSNMGTKILELNSVSVEQINE